MYHLKVFLAILLLLVTQVAAAKIKYVIWYRVNDETKHTWWTRDIANNMQDRVLNGIHGWSEGRYKAEWKYGMVRVSNNDVCANFAATGPMYNDMWQLVRDNTVA
ncbi:hypothetical protein K461DRAFT_298097 [Myriangium duriaei CBS 260.36]|uniref:Uncharacterized protein n=1 Tax=Myriangium duriaei CBS 260.36 TaxID=1168546 RepID=A0A9P4MBV0_9PEZI|nr:hypothetical protein K461DRAFT_298097 [Myriangium duriaei CBS 260.36]